MHITFMLVLDFLGTVLGCGLVGMIFGLLVITNVFGVNYEDAGKYGFWLGLVVGVLVAFGYVLPGG
jgi:hypothetical protein